MLDTPRPQSVMLYDGECGMCQRSVRWMLRHDREGKLFFAPLQLGIAAEVFARHSLPKETLNSAVLVSHYGTPQESIALGADVTLGCLALLGGGWALLGRLAGLVPRSVRDAAYRVIARNRIRLFGRADLCALPTAAERARFLGV